MAGGRRREKGDRPRGYHTGVRQNVREGRIRRRVGERCLDEAKTELSRLANDGAPSDATSVGAGLARNIATLVDARAAAVSTSRWRAWPRRCGRRRRNVATPPESAHEERTKRDDAPTGERRSAESRGTV